MVNCYHKPCDSIRPPHRAEFANIEFYKHTLQTLVYTTIELSKSSCFSSESLQKFYSVPSAKIPTKTKHQTATKLSAMEVADRPYSNSRAVGGDIFHKHTQPVSSLNDFIRFLKSL